MKIWIDFINTPQVTFFVPFIRDFKNDNHDILITCRDSGNTIDLLELDGLTYKRIGEKAGKGIVQKSMLFIKRLINLVIFIRKNKPDVAASQSSFYQPVVAGLLKIPCLYTNDNEHAKGNFFGFLFATRIILPVALENTGFTKRWPLRKKVSFYPSVKEAIYLSQNSELLNIKISGPGKRIYFRPEPWSAQYYKGPLNFFDDILLRLSNEYDVVVLPRDKNQAEHYLQKKFSRLQVAQKPLSMIDIARDCLLFIGAGGSMTREMAVIHIPVISIYQSELLSVDKYLINKGLIRINPKIKFEEIITVIENISPENKEMATLMEGEKSYALVKNLIYTLKHE